MGLFVGIARARVKIGMANFVYNVKRLIFWQRTAAAWEVGAANPADIDAHSLPNRAAGQKSGQNPRGSRTHFLRRLRRTPHLRSQRR